MKKIINKTLMATAISAAVAAGSVQAEDITVVSWGGAYTKSQVEAYHKPWMAQTGNTIVSEDYSGGLAEIKAQVEADNVTWNLVDVELSDAVRGCDEGILEVIDPSILPALQHLKISCLAPYMSALLVTSYGLPSLPMTVPKPQALTAWLTSLTLPRFLVSVVYAKVLSQT